jgi:hypothetical protein
MADKQSLATFLAAVHGVHVSGSGTKEASYYTAIDNLLDGIGDALKPKVRCVMHRAEAAAEPGRRGAAAGRLRARADDSGGGPAR